MGEGQHTQKYVLDIAKRGRLSIHWSKDDEHNQLSDCCGREVASRKPESREERDEGSNLRQRMHSDDGPLL